MVGLSSIFAQKLIAKGVAFAMKRDPMSLEGIYYSHAIPRNPAILMLMGLVFDKVHFPNAYMPTTGFDEKELDVEIRRLEALPRDFDTAELIGMLTFLKLVPVLSGFCEFLPDSSNLLNDKRFSPEVIARIYDRLHGPPKPGWVPMISSAYVKGLPGSPESMIYRGEYHRLANSVLESSKTGMPLINDVPGLPVFAETSSPRSDADSLAGILSILCMSLVMPEMHVMNPHDLMEFRDRSKKELRSFRRAMLDFAASLNRDVARDAPGEEIERQAEFFVRTEIAPRLDELRELSSKRSLSWIKRSALKMAPMVGAGYLTGGAYGALAALLTSGAVNVPAERKASDGSKEAAKSGLYYLLKVETKLASQK